VRESRRGQFVDGAHATSAAVERLARWWTEASQGARFELLRRSIQGDREAPNLEALQIAIYLAEVEAGEVAEG
jgi:hypothetical protein